MADQVLTLTPNATVVDGDNTGANPTHVAISDGLDTTWVEVDSREDVGNGRDWEVGLTTAPVAEDSAIKGVKLIVRGDNISGNGKLTAYIKDGTGAQITEAFQMTTTTKDHVGILYTAAPSGAPWTQAKIDALTVRGYAPSTSQDGAYATQTMKLTVEVLVNEPPTVTVTGPADADAGTAGVQVATSSPASAFTYADPEDDSQERYWGKTFSSTQYGATGFEAETSVATRDSGEVLSQDTTLILPGSLANGATYKDYFKASDAGSGGRYSAWSAGPAYTVVTSPPPVPTLVATAVYGVAVALEATSTGTPAPEFLRFETLIDGLWVVVRGAEAVPTTSGATKGVLDFEWRSGLQSSYRAFSIRGTGPSLVQSAPSTVKTITITLTQAEIADPLVPLSSVPLVFRRTGDEIMPMESEERGGRFVLSGVPHPVFVSDVVSGEEWDMDLVFQTQASYEAFESLRQAQRTLLLRAPDEPAPRNHMYVRLGPVRREALVGFDRVAKPWRYVSVHASERARP